MIKLQIKLFLFSAFVFGFYYGGLKFTEMKYGVNSPETLAKSEAPQFLTALYQPFYVAKGMVANNPVSASMDELRGKVKEMRKTSEEQLNSF